MEQCVQYCVVYVYTLYTLYTLYIARYIMYATLHQSSYYVLCTVYSVHCTVYSVVYVCSTVHGVYTITHFNEHSHTFTYINTPSRTFTDFNAHSHMSASTQGHPCFPYNVRRTLYVLQYTYVNSTYVHSICSTQCTMHVKHSVQYIQ